MIVRDEVHIIRRCLDSVAPLVDAVLIVDTGSTDGTQAAIRDFLAASGLPGEIVEEPWRDFAWNRSHALALLRRRREIDYALMIDADEVLVFEPGFDSAAFKRSLSHDFYAVRTLQADIVNLRPQLCSNRLAFRFRGALHEFLEAPHDDATSGIAEGFHNRPIQDSARNRNPRKFLDDARTLETLLAGERDPAMAARYTFYLAQSYRDGGEPAKALDAYLRHAALGHWAQEAYVSLLNAAQLREGLGHSDNEVLGTYLKAQEACPDRAEALHGLVRYCREHGLHQIGCLIGRAAIGIARPAEGLFVQPWIYRYGLLDEFSIVAYWAGHYRESLDACRRLLTEGELPAVEVERVRRNAAFAEERLQHGA
jgi:hypothetical protein